MPDVISHVLLIRDRRYFHQSCAVQTLCNFFLILSHVPFGSWTVQCVARAKDGFLRVDELTRKPTYNILLIGFNQSGKTWLLEQLRHTYLKGRAPSDRIASTVGQNVLDLPYQKSVLHFWDLGGAPSMRELWQQYLPDAHTIVWVLDGKQWALDTPVQQETATSYQTAVLDQLFPIAMDAALRGQTVLVLVNKMDAMDPQDVCEDMRPPHVLEHVEATVLKHWARFMDNHASKDIITPHWSFHGVSAVTGYVQRLASSEQALTNIFQRGPRRCACGHVGDSQSL